MNIKKYIKKEKIKVEEALDKYLHSKQKYPPAIHKAIRYSVFSGGKRIRPIMSIATFRMCGGKDKQIYPVACGIELIHTYSLIHDDLPAMDNDDYRRGKLSCHKKFNETIAILAGDALLTEGFRLLSLHKSPAIVKKNVAYVSKKIGSCGMIGGQLVDMEIEFNKKKKREEKLKLLDYINAHKTGALIQASLISGVITAEAKEYTIKIIEKYGYYIGFLFQIVDDILDNQGYAKILGKDEAIKKAEQFLFKSKEEIKKLKTNIGYLYQLPDIIFERIKTGL